MISKNIPHHLLLAAFLMFSVFSVEAQAQVTYSGKQAKAKQTNERSAHFNGNGFVPAWSLTLAGGPSMYFGDIRQYRFYPIMNHSKELKFGGSLILERSVSPVFSLRGQGLYSGLASASRKRDMDINSDLIEFNLSTAINLNNLFGTYRSSQKWGIDLLVGIGLVNFNTTLYQTSTGKIIAQRGFGSGSGIGGRTAEALIMGGIELKFDISENWSIRFETANRALNTDLFEHVSGGFHYDIYNHTALGLSYRLSRSGKSIKMVPEDEPGLLIVDPDANAPLQPDQQSNEEMVNFNRVIDVLDLDYNRQESVSSENETITPPVETEIDEEINYEPEPVKIYGIEYRVQIRARYGTKISVDYLVKTYNLSAYEIKEDSFNGYYIYTIGSYPTSDEAASHRNAIRSKHNIYDAFVVAFKDGVRLQKLP